MSENNLTYHSPICITDFTDEGVSPFQCSHLICDDCNEQYYNSRSIYKCPICRSNAKKNSQYVQLVMSHEIQKH